MGNSCKFTHAGKISVTAMVRSGCVEVAVADMGIGIPNEKLRQIFLPFEQVDSGITRRCVIAARVVWQQLSAACRLLGRPLAARRFF